MLKPFPVAIITSRFNEEITEALYKGATERLKELEFTEIHIDDFWVPGAVEIPLVAQRLVRTQKYQAIIALGAVIRGETTHYDYVCQQVSAGCQRVSLDNDIPIIFGVLTTDNAMQARERVGGRKGHKGREAADALIDVMSALQNIK